jgi:hypothetical protein
MKAPDGRIRNGRTSSSRLSYRLSGDHLSLRDRLLKRLIADSRTGRETSSADANIEGGRQYGARAKELRDDGWEILNRVERIDRGARGWFHIDFEAMRQLGRHDLLALALPEHYPNGVPKIDVPLPTSIDTLPLFAVSTAAEGYPD